MKTDEIVERAIQGHASTRDAIRWAIQQEREWVGLTAEEIDDLWKTEVFDVHYGMPRLIEAKLKEKNT